jgi:hypothetical protein
MTTSGVVCSSSLNPHDPARQGADRVGRRRAVPGRGGAPRPRQNAAPRARRRTKRSSESAAAVIASASSLIIAGEYVFSSPASAVATSVWPRASIVSPSATVS